MNKDVIYIEPEDDITDIITKIENSKEKIVALVPPKKASVFRSIVNIKLIVKAGKNAEKTVVLVTTDPSIMKLAGATKLPVTKNLQSAPVIPEAEEEIETTSKEAVVEPETENDADEETKDEKAKSDEEIDEKTDEDKEDEDSEDGDSEDEEDEDEVKSDRKIDKKKKKLTGNWLLDHKKQLIFGGIGAIAAILLLVWMFAIAPAADIIVAVRTTTTNFSESATFTNNMVEENISEGKFYLTEKSIETVSEVEFEATGTKNVGEKASGKVTVYAYFSKAGTIPIEKGSTYFTFTYDNNNLKYVASEGVQLSWDGSIESCKDHLEVTDQGIQCKKTATVSVEAIAPGEDYNIPASTSGWRANVAVWTNAGTEMSGGTNKVIKVVQQSDIDAALEKVKGESLSPELKEKLLGSLEEGAFVIDSSYRQTVGEPNVSPALGEEVEEGKKAKLSVTTTDSISIIDKTKVEEFIAEKAKLTDDYKIYQMNDPFIENFTETDKGYAGKIKTSFVSGPKVTENDVINVIKGKGLGEARAALLDAFNGIDSNNTKINVSYPWVFSIPGNPTKITVTIEVEE